MKDLHRKFDRFVKERDIVSSKKPRGVSPVLTSAFSPSRSNGFSLGGQSSTKIVKKVNNRTFSMTVSFNPRFDIPKSKDHAIYHQDKQQKNIVLKPEVSKAKSPKHNPILQNGQEPCFEFKPSYKSTPLSNKMTIFNEELPVKKRADGECKNMDDHRSLSPRSPAIKTFYSSAMREDQSPENPRRIRKAVVSSLKNLFDPIVDGDIEGLKFRRVRKGVASTQPSEETLKLNNRGKLLPTELGYSPKGRVFRDSSLVGFAHPTEEPAPFKGKRFGSPQFKKQPEMEGLLKYSYSGIFRQDTVSPKCNSQPISQAMKSLNNSHMF